jgi:hypothetical protein
MTDTETDTDDLPARDDVLDDLSVAIREARAKVESGRVYDPEAERVRQGWIRTLARSAAEYRKMLADRDDLADLRERVARIEQNNRDDGNPYRYK